MLKSLNSPIARCFAKYTRRRKIFKNDDDLMEFEVLLCRGQCVMLKCNLWVEYGLVNGVLGYIEYIFYVVGSKAPQLPLFTKVIFEKDKGVPFDRSCPNIVPITPVIRGKIKEIPLKMGRNLTIYKSWGMTLQ